MKKIISYKCEICNSNFSEKSAAVACEARGRVDKEVIVPLHVLFEDSGFYKNILFCIANQGIQTGEHWCSPTLWACRDTGIGDSLGKEMCGGGHCVSKDSPLLNENSGKIDFKSERFKRMVSFLNSKKIPIKYWDGKTIKYL